MENLMDLSDYHNIIKSQLETQLSNCDYVYIVRTLDGTDVPWLQDSVYEPRNLYEIPYRVNNSTKLDSIQRKGTVSLYNCVTNKQETVNIHHIFNTSIHFKGHKNHNDLNKTAIKEFKDHSRKQLNADDLVLLGEKLDISLLDFYSLDPYGGLNTFANLKLIKFFKCNDVIDVLDVDVDEARDKWTKLIYEAIDQAKDYLLNTKLEVAEDDAEEIEEIDSLISLMDETRAEVSKDLKDINITESIIDYWPAIILPKPLYL